MPVTQSSDKVVMNFNIKEVSVVGMTMCEGQDLKGVEAGPKALRDAGLHRVIDKLGWKVQDVGDIDCDAAKLDSFEDKPAGNPSRTVKAESYVEEELPHSKLIGEACKRGFHTVCDAVNKNTFVLTLGGDHSIATCTIAGMLSKHPDLVVVWVDAHGDINTPESSPSRHYHGMPVAHLMNLFAKEAPGFGWLQGIPALKGSSVGFIGLRDIDDTEVPIIKESGVHAYTMKAVDAEGIGEVVRKTLADIDPTGTKPIHLSFDIDACDPAIAPGTGTQARGGLSYREAHYICEALHDTGRLVSMDLVEVNPLLDKEDAFLHGDNKSIAENATKTVRLGIELISSALGKNIL